MSADRSILIAESRGFSERALERVRAVGPPRLEDLDRKGLLAAVADVDVLWVRLRHRIDAEVMAAAPRLTTIVSATTGLNHIDVEEAERRGILVLSLQGEAGFLRQVRATAEHTMALMLALLRNVPAAAADARTGEWRRDRFRGRELHEKTVGVIGYGRLGRIVARYLGAFDAEVLTTDPALAEDDLEEDVTLVELDELLPRSDVVTLHASLSPGPPLLGAAEISAMRPGALLVNTARGELVEEEALLEALRSGHVAGAALDVLAGESATGMAHHPLVRYAREHANLIVTPHIGGATLESMAKTEEHMAERLVATPAASAAGAR